MRYSLAAFKPQFLEDLVRVGRPFDGGYLVNERAIRESKVLLSFGVSDDWSFEEDFLRRKPDLRIFCFDFSISKEVFRARMLNALNEILSMRFALRALTLNFHSVRHRFRNLKDSLGIYSAFSKFIAQNSVHFSSKGIANERGRGSITFADAMQMIPATELPENSVFIKMDIEQSEYRVLPDLIAFEKYISGMVIEFHDLDIVWPMFVELMGKLNVHFITTHIHGNNYGGLIPDSTTPRTLEISFLKKSLLVDERPPCRPAAYPIPELDCANDPYEKDIPLYF